MAKRGEERRGEGICSERYCTSDEARKNRLSNGFQVFRAPSTEHCPPELLLCLGLAEGPLALVVSGCDCTISRGEQTIGRYCLCWGFRILDVE